MKAIVSFLVIQIFVLNSFGQPATINSGLEFAQSEISVVVDPRVEIISTICRLAEYEEYSQKSYPHYVQLVEDYFTNYKDHKVIQQAKKLREENEMAYNAPMALAVHLAKGNTGEYCVQFREIPEELDSRWTMSSVHEFVTAMNEFIRDSKFADFFNEQQALYKIAINRFGEVLDDRNISNWFAEYFGMDPRYKYKIILALQNGGANYGAQLTDKKGDTKIFSIIGCWQQDKEGMPLFDDDILATVVHEFCHSYTNPIVKELMPSLQNAGDLMFKSVGEKMTKMAYPNSEIMLYEYFVRAVVIRYLQDSEGSQTAEKQLKQDMNRGFAGINRLVDCLSAYENDRISYQEFRDYYPVLIIHFTKHSNNIENDMQVIEHAKKQKWDRMKTDGPQIVKMIPVNGSARVSHELKEIQIFFDREMNPKSFAVMYDPSEHDLFPSISGKAYYNESNTIYSIPVTLKPNSTYRFGLNSFKSIGFKDANGLGLYPVKIEFRTK